MRFASFVVVSLVRLGRPRRGVTMSAMGRDVVVDPFCLRQFDATSGKAPFIALSVEAFEAELNARFEASGKALVDGYAPFCKHLFVENFARCEAAVLAITPENERLLRSGYSARTLQELAVLSRWFDRAEVTAALGGALPAATTLDVILYSRDQIRKENAAMGNPNVSDAPWGVVSVKAQNVAAELPMQPITMMRNSLGADEGGSGVPLDHDKYAQAVAYWAKHAPIQ